MVETTLTAEQLEAVNAANEKVETLFDDYDEKGLQTSGAGTNSMLYEALDKMDTYSWFRGTILNKLPDVINETFNNSQLARTSEAFRDLDGDHDVSAIEALYITKSAVDFIRERAPQLFNEPSAETIETIKGALPEEFSADPDLIQTLGILHETSMEEFVQRATPDAGKSAFNQTFSDSAHGIDRSQEPLLAQTQTSPALVQNTV